MKIYIGNHEKWAEKIKEKTHLDVIVLPDHQKLNPSVMNHSDMMCCAVNNTLVLAPETAAALSECKGQKMDDNNIKVVTGQAMLSPAYPQNIAYNVAFVGCFAVHNFKYTDEILKEYIVRAGFKLLNVKQGYTNCSMLVIDNKHVITADDGIEKVLNSKGVSVLKIQPGHIRLPGMNYGFIGGAGFSIKETVYFFGNLDMHPDGDRIRSFIHERGKACICLSDQELVDIGSCRVINQ